jgi:hypothetical protein
VIFFEANQKNQRSSLYTYIHIYCTHFVLIFVLICTHLYSFLYSFCTLFVLFLYSFPFLFPFFCIGFYQCGTWPGFFFLKYHFFFCIGFWQCGTWYCFFFLKFHFFYCMGFWQCGTWPGNFFLKYRFFFCMGGSHSGQEKFSGPSTVKAYRLKTLIQNFFCRIKASSGLENFRFRDRTSSRIRDRYFF